MNKTFFSLTAVVASFILIGAGCNININTPPAEVPAKTDVTSKTPPLVNIPEINKLPDNWVWYNDQQALVSYGYPKDFTAQPKQQVPVGIMKDVTATRFDIPDRFITGTNLGTGSAIFVYKNCTIEGMAQAESRVVTKNGKKFTEYTTTEGAAGNRYNTVLISTNNEITGCVNFLLYMHSLNVDNFAPGQVVTQFDHAGLTNIAYEMAGSVMKIRE